jgi:hypothetical protein
MRASRGLNNRREARPETRSPFGPTVGKTRSEYQLTPASKMRGMIANANACTATDPAAHLTRC